MKKHFALLSLAITMLLSSASLVASAQASTATPAPFATPSATTPLPTQLTDAGKFICSGTGSTIQLKLNTPDAAATHYEWYKYDASGTAVLVSKSTTPTYNETPAAPGYYKYKLVQLNSHECPSPASDIYSVYVLPPLEPLLAASNGGVVCSNQAGSETVITASGYDNHYAYTYQWFKYGAPYGSSGVQNLAAGASIPDLHVTETTNGTYTYKLVMAYKLNPGCTGEKAQSVTADKTPDKPSIDFGN